MEEQSRIEAAKKDPKNFKYFYDLWYKPVYLFIYRRTDDETLSADITQQVFLKAMQNITKYEYRGFPFSSWLYRIAHNELMQHFRDQNKVRVVCIENTGLAEILEDDVAGYEVENRELIFKTLQKLKPQELELIEMRYFEKRSFKEISEITNVSENNAKVKVHRILERLRNLITVQA